MDASDATAVRVRRIANRDPRTLEQWVNQLLRDLDPSEVIRVGDIVQEEDPDGRDVRYACTIVYCLRPKAPDSGG